MKDSVSVEKGNIPVLFPYDPEIYWEKLRQVIKEEILKVTTPIKALSPIYDTPGLTYKPLYKIAEVCTLFQVTKPTIYDWIKLGKLKPFKIRSRVYFLWQDIQQLLPREI